MWAHPLPDKTELSQLYSGREYYECGTEAPSGSAGYGDYMAMRFLKQMDHRRLALRLIQLVEGASDQFMDSPDGTDPTHLRTADRPRLLDVGCAMGHFMDAAHDCGFDVEGVDRNADAITKLSEKYRFPARCAEWPDHEDGDYDAVTMLDMLEHLADPFLSLSKAASVLRRGGYLVVTTPDHGSLLAKLLGKRNELVRKVALGEHLALFTRKTLTAALNEVGFENVEIHSYGLTLDLATAAKRVGAALPALGAVTSAAIKVLGLSNVAAHIDHRHNMIAYATRRADESADL